MARQNEYQSKIKYVQVDEATAQQKFDTIRRIIATALARQSAGDLTTGDSV